MVSELVQEVMCHIVECNDEHKHMNLNIKHNDNDDNNKCLTNLDSGEDPLIMNPEMEFIKVHPGDGWNEQHYSEDNITDSHVCMTSEQIKDPPHQYNKEKLDTNMYLQSEVDINLPDSEGMKYQDIIKTI